MATNTNHMHAKMSDEDFMEMFERLGAAEMSRQTDYAQRAIHQRRRNLEKQYGIVLTPPGRGQSVEVERTARREHFMENGSVLIFSDAHYWPQLIPTIHYAICEVAEEIQPELIIANGDIFDGASMSRHAKINWEETPSPVDEIYACQARLAEIENAAPKARKIWTLGNHCVDPETELLTKRGWVRYTDIQADDQVFSYVGAGRATWTEIDEVMIKPFSGDLVTVEGPRISMAMTPGHRVLGYQLNWRTRQYDRLKLHKATELPYSLNVPVTGQVNGGGVDLSEGQIRLAAWLLTDGSSDNCSYSIYQSKPEGRAEVERILALAKVDEYSIYERDRDIQEVCGRALLKKPLLQAQYYIGASDTQKIKEYLPNTTDLPEWAGDMDEEQFQWFLESLVDGDGMWDGAGDGRCAVMYGKEPFLSSLQAVAAQHGWRARLAVDSRGDHRLWLSKRPNIRIEKKNYGTMPYEGDVWCLRVPHENFMVRRNGSAYFTGNCARFESYVANHAPEMAKVHGVHLRDHFPQWETAWSCWINDEIVVKHRWHGGVHAAWNNVLKAGKTIVTGHTHQLNIRPFVDYNGLRYGIECGTCSEPNGPQYLAYTEDNPKNWVSAAVVLTIKDGVLLPPEPILRIDKGKYAFRGELRDVGRNKRANSKSPKRARTARKRR